MFPRLFVIPKAFLNDEALAMFAGQFVTPKAGLNNRGEWRFVINMDGDDDQAQQYTQLVRTERCL